MRVSIVIPYYPMKNHVFFLKRCLESIEKQTFKDYEVVITQEGRSAENTNRGIDKARGEIIKILHMDDYFTHENVLKEIVGNFTGAWQITGCSNNLSPIYYGDIHLGNNKLGGPSCLTISRDVTERFNPQLDWLFDCDFYKRMYNRYGLPQILSGNYITIGEGEHQATNIISNAKKEEEKEMLRDLYV